MNGEQCQVNRLSIGTLLELRRELAKGLKHGAVIMVIVGNARDEGLPRRWLPEAIRALQLNHRAEGGLGWPVFLWLGCRCGF